jgi:alcohol dehydrogenase class IV
VIAPFRWQDGERVIVFGRGKLADAQTLIGSPFVLLTTPRAAAAAAELVDGAETVHHIAPGLVDELAGALRSNLHGAELLVALGGGRVIDVAKALAAADPPRRVAAIPTTLSGAEMTAIHRHADGVPMETARVRPAIVLNDPDLSASQPEAQLAESAANALGHAVEGPLTPLANPVATLAAHEAARLIAQAFADGGALPDRDALALAALLAGYVIGSTGYGMHHVLAQTLARFGGVGHGAANAIMLPHSIDALSERSPDVISRLRDAAGAEPRAVAERLLAVTGTARLRDAGVTQTQLDQCANEAASRPELHLTPPAADLAELRTIYAAAF